VRAVDERVGLVEALAALRHCVVTRAEAVTGGVSDATIKGLCTDGRWIRVGRGVYGVVACDGGPFREVATQLLIAGDEATPVGRTAAALHGGLDLEWDGSVDIVMPRTSSGRRHRRRTLTAEMVTTAGGLRATTVLQTVLDLAAELDDVPWGWVLEAAIRSKHISVSLVGDALGDSGRIDPAGVARRVLA